MFTHETFFAEHTQEIDRVINAELDRRKAVGASRSLTYEHIASRVYRAPASIGDRIKPGDLLVDVQHPLLESDERYRAGSTAHQKTYRDRAISLLPGVPGDWLEGKSTPTPLADAVQRLLDPAGPEQELLRRRRIVLEEQRVQAAEQHLRLLEERTRGRANEAERKRMAQWHRIPREIRAALRAGDKTQTGNELAAAIAAERDNLAPPVGWVAPPEEVTPQPVWIDVTFRPDAVVIQPGEKYSIDVTTMRRFDPAGKTEITVETVDAATIQKALAEAGQ